MSLAVKYRPKTFADVIGQAPVTKAVQAALARPVVPQAWLFVGGSGFGKTTLARLIAAHVAGGKIEPSNVIEIDAATNSGADAIRDVAARAHYKAIGASPVKTIIVDEAHRLSAAAWSSLLKPIEEPPAHVYWCLATTETGKIPDTIKTRCVTFHLKPVDEVVIYDLLAKVAAAENLKVSEEVLEAVAENSKGSPRQALVDLELCADAASANQARSLMQSALQMKGPVDLARALIGKAKPSWPQLTKIINSIDADPESTRIVVCNYIAGALMKATDREAPFLLRVLDCFSSPYQQSDKLAPLLVSCGLALELGR